MAGDGIRNGSSNLAPLKSQVAITIKNVHLNWIIPYIDILFKPFPVIIAKQMLADMNSLARNREEFRVQQTRL